MFRGALRLVRAVPAHIEAGGARQGLAYAWWIPLLCALATVALALISLFQRDAVFPPQPVAVGAGIIIVAFVIEFVARTWMPWWMTSALLIGSVAWLLADASNVSRPLDMAPVILAFLSAQITATDGPRIGGFVAAISVALLVPFGLDGRILHVAEILVGFIIGSMLRWQMRALVAERAARAGERERATLDERQRIAREIHDLVGHSLSVTLLHVTGARRALTEDADIDEAVDALRDAERIGRKAMTDIRGTVSVLASETSSTQPLPDADDIADLVDGVRAAGIDVRYDVHGTTDHLPSSTGIGVYRVAQESLANVAKHAPSSPVHLRLDIEPRQVRLQVHNRLAHPGAPVGSGSGLNGMAARAEQLGGTCRSGAEGDQWTVDLIVPIAADTAATTVDGSAERGTGTDDAPHRDHTVRRLLK